MLLGKRERADTVSPIIVGSILPDVPMFVFYAWERSIGTPVHVIFRERYYEAGWQAVFNSFHSFPLIAIAWLGAYTLRARWLMWMTAAMFLHALEDFPLHHNDAHAQFYPFSHWRFISPVSYWDPAHYGRISAMVEVATCAFASAWLWHRYPNKGPRIAVCALAAAYATHWFFVFGIWT